MMTTRGIDKRFSLTRLALLTRNRLLDEVSVVGIGAGVILALNLLGILGGRRAFFNAHGFGGGFWVPAIVVGGLILAAQAFKGMHDGKAGTEWVLLPATPLEKYAAAFVDSALLYPLAAAMGGMALSALLSLLERAAGGPGGAIWTPFRLGALRAWADYAALAVVLLAGSASFRKAALIKTAGLAAAYCLAAGILLSLGFWAFFKGGSAFGSADISIFGNMGRGFTISGEGGVVSEAAQRAIGVGADVARYAILPAFAILFGAAKVAEKESRDEVQ
jgi:hypothetical protein